MGLPPKLGTVWNAQNRWDEFDFVHIHLSNFIHDSGQFLPFHRWFITVLERALQEECGYKGALPYCTYTSPTNLGDVPEFDLAPS